MKDNEALSALWAVCGRERQEGGEMYPLDRLWDIWDLELFLFGGIPEAAEQMYGREFHSLSQVRLTRQGMPSSRPAVTDAEDDIVYYLELDLETSQWKIIDGEVT